MSRKDALPAAATAAALRVFGIDVADSERFTPELRDGVEQFQGLIDAAVTGAVTEHVRDVLFDRPTLAVEDTGPAVYALQHALNGLGWRLRLTGVFDLDTKNALDEFQGRAGITRSGVADDETWAALGIAP